MKSLKNKNVVIVGGGLAGTCLANSLVDTMNVTVIEKGPQTGYQVPSKVFKDKVFGQIDTYVQGVGGTTHLWHNGLMEVESSNVKGEFRGTIEKAKNYLAKAAASLGLIGDFEEQKNKELNHYKKIIQQLDINDTAEIDTILVPKTLPLKQFHKDVKVFSNATVDSYSMVGNKVASVAFRSLGEPLKLCCDFLIIASGGIGSVKVVSNLLNTYGINNHDVGKGLIDHPMGFIGKIKVSKKNKKLFKMLCHHDMPNYSSRCGIKIHSKKLNHIFYFRPAMSMTNNLSLYKFKSKLGVSSWSKRLKMIFEPQFYHPDILIEVIAHLLKLTFNTKYFAIWGVFEQQSTNDRLVSSEGKDVDYINWSVSESELCSYSEALKKLEHILQPIVDDIDIVKTGLSDYLWSAAHHSSTMSYGSKDWELNSDLKINALSNAYVCDGSVIEQNAYVNTGLLIGQLAHRLSDHLATQEN
jgi:hypothetical protein